MNRQQSSPATISLPATMSLPVTREDVRLEMKELLEEVRRALLSSQSLQIAAMREAVTTLFAEGSQSLPVRPTSLRDQSGSTCADQPRYSGRVGVASAGAESQKHAWFSSEGPAQLTMLEQNDFLLPSPPCPPSVSSQQQTQLCVQRGMLSPPSGQLGTITHLKSASGKAQIQEHFESRQKLARSKQRRFGSMQSDSELNLGVKEQKEVRTIPKASRLTSSPWPAALRLSEAPGVDRAKDRASRHDYASQPKVWTDNSELADVSMDMSPMDAVEITAMKPTSNDRLPRFVSDDSNKLDDESARAVKLGMSNNKARPQYSLETFDSGSHSSLHQRLQDFVMSASFEAFIGMAVISNAMYIGLQTDFTARWGSPAEFVTIDRVVDTCFCSVFLLELLLRIYVHRFQFVQPPDVGWNLFDCFVVLAQFFELFVAWTSGEQLPKNFSMLRILRILRAIRIIRLVKMLRPLRILVMSILGSMQPLFWTVMLLFFVIYLMGVFLTQSVADYKLATEVPHDKLVVLNNYYGTLTKAMLSLFQSVSGGVDWENMVNPLIEDISPVIGLMFALYIAFSLLALMNVVSGYFVQSALENTKHENETYMVTLVRQVLNKLDMDHDGEVTWTEFEDALEFKEMQEYFKTVDVDISDAPSLWNLLDVDGSGSIDAEDLLNGCVRLQGHASALGQNLVMRELGRVCSKFTITEKYLSDIFQMLLSTGSIGPLNGKDSGALRTSAVALANAERSIPSYVESPGIPWLDDAVIEDV